MRKRAIILAAAMVSSAAFAQSDKLKACFLYIGPVGDLGWTYAHNEAREKAEKALPWLETKYVESVPESEPGPIIDKLVQDKCQVIFATSFGYIDGVVAAAKKYPNVIFAHASGYKRAPNLATFMTDFYQVYYINGLIAGALTKTNKIAYVGAFPIPEVKRHINAMTLGAKEINPNATMNVKWINSWYDPAKAGEATEALLSEGADTFAFTEDSPATIQVAAKKKAISFSHYSPMKTFAPDYVVSGQLVDWSTIYIDFLKKVKAKKYTNKNLQNVDYWWLMGEKAVLVGSQPGEMINPKYIPALKAKQVKDRLTGKTMSAYDLIMNRYRAMNKVKYTFDPFTGPIKDRNGVERVAAGKTLNVGELTSLEWAANGVVGEWPNEPK